MKNRYMPPLIKRIIDIAKNDSLTPQKIAEVKSLLELLPRIIDIRKNEIADYKAIQASNPELGLETPEEISIDMKDYGNDTALAWAAYGGHVELVRILIDAKASLDSKNRNGSTPLIFAAMRGKTEVVQVLIDAKADIHRTNDTNSTALMQAALNRHLKIIDQLIDTEEKMGKGNNEAKKVLAHLINNSVMNGSYLYHPTISLFLNHHVTLTKEAYIQLYHYFEEGDFRDPELLYTLTILFRQQRKIHEPDIEIQDTLSEKEYAKASDYLSKLEDLDGIYKQKTVHEVEAAIGNQIPKVLLNMMADYDNSLMRVSEKYDPFFLKMSQTNIDFIILKESNKGEKKPTCNIM